MASDKDDLPRCFFFYGTYRDDAIQTGAYWNSKSLLKGLMEAKTVKLFGYKMYQNQWDSSPFAIKTSNEKDYIVGRLNIFDDALFDKKLKRMNEIRRYKPDGEQDEYSCTQTAVTVYLDHDDEKTLPYLARTYIKHNSNIDKTNCVAVESNDWMRRNLLISETKQTTNNRIFSGKGGVRLRSSGSTRYFVEWKPKKTYKKGDIVAIDPQKRKYGNYISSFKLWAMCINPHKSKLENKPQKYDIFADLLMNVTSFIKIFLTEHVEGFNNELSVIIIAYCYKTNTFWWNGCYPKHNDKASCGHLVAGLMSNELCKTCAMKGMDNDNKSKSEPIKGAVISLNKTDGSITRTYSVNKKNEQKENVVLRTNIESKMEKEKIYNLLKRNFDESMDGLIKAAINKDKKFVYKHHNKEEEVYIGDTNVWALYDIDEMNGNNEELLCALIWRFVHGKTKSVNQTKLMFEVLFLSTYEHVRFNHYGQQMAKEIELYCISNGYDLMSVAAVPGHGEAFWKSNGFRLEHSAPNTDKVDEKRSKNDWLRNNMLVFDDTPLYAKYMDKY